MSLVKTIVGGAVIWSMPEVSVNSTPTVCSPAQGLVALYVLKGITENSILEVLDAIPDPVQRYTAQTGYSRAIEWRRDSPTMQNMALLLNLSQEDLDTLFTYAVEVVV